MEKFIWASAFAAVTSNGLLAIFTLSGIRAHFQTQTVHLQNKTEVYFSDIGQMLGFSPNTVISRTSTAERAVDLEHGFHDLYV